MINNRIPEIIFGLNAEGRRKKREALGNVDGISRSMISEYLTE